MCLPFSKKDNEIKSCWVRPLTPTDSPRGLNLCMSQDEKADRTGVQFSSPPPNKNIRIAQLVERSAYNRRVAGSNPAADTIFGPIAQLVRAPGS